MVSKGKLLFAWLVFRRVVHVSHVHEEVWLHIADLVESIWLTHECDTRWCDERVCLQLLWECSEPSMLDSALLLFLPQLSACLVLESIISAFPNLLFIQLNDKGWLIHRLFIVLGEQWLAWVPLKEVEAQGHLILCVLWKHLHAFSGTEYTYDDFNHYTSLSEAA